MDYNNYTSLVKSFDKNNLHDDRKVGGYTLRKSVPWTWPLAWLPFNGSHRIFCFCFSATLYQQWIDLFGRLNFSYQNSYPANTFTSISRMNKNTNEQDGSQCFRSLLDLWLRNQNRNFGQWSFKSKSKSVQKNNQNRTFRRHLNDTKNSKESTRHDYIEQGHHDSSSRNLLSK